MKIEGSVFHGDGYRFIPENDADKNAIRMMDFLLEENLITKQIKQATLMEYQVCNDNIGLILIRSNFITQKQYTEAVLKINPDGIIFEHHFTDIFPPEKLQEFSTMVAAETNSEFILATMHSEWFAKANLEHYASENGKKIRFVNAVPEKIDDYLSQIGTSGNGETDLFEKILKKSLVYQASDLYFLPKLKTYTIFFRRMGQKHAYYEGPLSEYMSLVARIKDRCGIDMTEKRIPQDGSFTIENNGKYIDMRVSTIPATQFGTEYVTIRSLDPDRVNPSLDKLGISNIRHWMAGVSRPAGLCLICGPTGSGKTTTLNASIQGMNRFSKQIYTAEDPVEYRIPYVAQVNINESVGLTYRNALRAFMRSAPDVIVVGEIRDEETARIAIKASDTGHLVFGTLHTGTIKETIGRLRDLGVRSEEFKHLLRTVLVQRLIRTVCPECKNTIKKHSCTHCLFSGYHGRTIISECFYFDSPETFEKAMSSDKTFWQSMVENAIEKMEEGVTDKEEVVRVFGQEAISILIEKGYADKSESII